VAPSPINILIVEDNLSHQKITEYVLKKNNVGARIRVVRDGQEILDYLFRRGAYTDDVQYPMPQLILLDLNLPKHDGREVLKLIKNDPNLKSIPVVIVSTSDREEDVVYARENGAAAYISKASGFDKFNAELGAVLQFALPAP
jgi:CheY-like chemotaxis protein